MPYVADPGRYGSMVYCRCGRSGVRLPAISLGLWHNFGEGFALGRPSIERSLDRIIMPALGFSSLVFGAWYALGALTIVPYTV